MKVAIFSLKGGQGKTTLGTELALNLGAGIVTNEVYSPLEMILPESSIIKLGANDQLPQIPDEVPVVYDFGGYADKRVLDAVKEAKHTIVPICYESKLDMQLAISTVQELEGHAQSIALVINKTAKEKVEEAVKLLGELFPKYPLFIVNKSKALANLAENKKPVSELVQGNALNAWTYRNLHKQINELVEFIKA